MSISSQKSAYFSQLKTLKIEIPSDVEYFKLCLPTQNIVTNSNAGKMQLLAITQVPLP